MRYSNSEVAHRWVHGLLDNHNEIEGSNLRGDGKSLYSYNTVIAQCLDRHRNVFVVIDQTLTPTTAKHISYVERALHSNLTVIRTHINSNYFNNVDFLGCGQFDKEKRLDMVTHFLKILLNEYKYVITGKTLDASRICKHSLYDLDKLDKIYNDCSLEDWLRCCKLPDAKDRKSDSFKLRRMARLILDERTDEEITDSLFGKGTWHKMTERIAPLLKARATRENRLEKERLERERKINAYMGDLDGLRKLWREHRESIPQELRSISELYYGGNVLLRFSKRSGHVETSLGIQITFEECHRYWKIIKDWHDHGTFCEGLRMSGYRVESFNNDILKAGCHRIAFCEMQRMYDELCELEAA